MLSPIAALALTSLLILSSCTPNPEQTPPITTIIRPTTLNNPQTIPSPKEETILTISGKINTTNYGASLQLDRPTIEQLQIVEYQIFDLFERKENSFEGVFLSDLIALAQPQKDATKLTLSAINDYQIEIPIKIIEDVKILFALKQNDQYMEMNYRGPAMLIVPPYKNNLLFVKSRSSYWIWQIESILIE